MTEPIHITAAYAEPSPLIAELARRWGEIARGASADQTPEQRRAALRRDMEIVRLGGMEAALIMTEVIAGRLPPRDLGEIKDPLSALANLNRSIIQIALAEERFDETDAERAARFAAEAEAAARAAAGRADSADQLRRVENRRQVQGGIRAVTLTGLGLGFDQREKLLGGLFRELDASGAYDTEPAGVVADICLRLGIEDQELARCAAEYRARKDRMAALARTHLEALQGRPIVEVEEAAAAASRPDAASSPPPARAQGPPRRH